MNNKVCDRCRKVYSENGILQQNQYGEFGEISIELYKCRDRHYTSEQVVILCPDCMRDMMDYSFHRFIDEMRNILKLRDDYKD